MFCSKCGSEMSDGARFCPKCGAAVAGVMPSGNGSVPSSGSVQQAATPQVTATPQAAVAPQRAAASGGGIKGVWQCFLNVAKTYWSSFICGGKQQRGAYWKSRMGRKDFWSFSLVFYLISLPITGIISALTGSIPPAGMFLSVVYYFIVGSMGVIVQARRMHDTGKSAWFMLIPVYNLILDCTASQDGENKFGQKPGLDSGEVTNKRPSKYSIILAVIVGVAAILSAVSAASSDGFDWSDDYSSSSYSSSSSSSSDIDSVLKDTEKLLTKLEKAVDRGDLTYLENLDSDVDANATAERFALLDEDEMTSSQKKRYEKLAERMATLLNTASSY